jgi:hypothetical protein
MRTRTKTVSVCQSVRCVGAMLLLLLYYACCVYAVKKTVTQVPGNWLTVHYDCMLLDRRTAGAGAHTVTEKLLLNELCY